MKFSKKIIENWRSWKMRFFWVDHFEFFKSAILIFFCFISVKKAACLYEVSFFSALWMGFPESWKRSCPNFYAHDCICIAPYYVMHRKTSLFDLNFSICPYNYMSDCAMMVARKRFFLASLLSFENSFEFNWNL